MEQLGPVILQVAMGVGLAACAGLRVFLPLFVVSLAGAFDWLPLADRFEWLASWPAVTVFGVAVVTEMMADKVPWLDHALDVGESWLKPIAGAVLAVAVLTELAPLERTVLGIMAGASAAGVVQLLKAKLRVVSTAMTGGAANPLLSVAEDGLAVTGTVLSLVMPLLVLMILVVLAVVAILWLRRTRARLRERSLGSVATSD